MPARRTTTTTKADTMSWDTSTRKAQLPQDWPKRVAECKRKARGRCEWLTNGQRCKAYGTDADHRGKPDDHDDLQWLCRTHHNIKTAGESLAARGYGPGRKRAQERHPGRVGVGPRSSTT